MASQSPLDDSLTDSYAKGWLAMSQMIWSGASWSGRERNCTFVNLGDGHFADVSSITGLDFPDDARALALTDWDGDGDLDLWIKNRTGPQLRFMENTWDSPNFVSLRLVSTNGNRDAIGARAEVRAGGKRLVQVVTAGHGYLAQSSKTLTFGLGQAGIIDRAEVRWPDGARESLPALQAGRHYTYEQGSGRAVSAPPRQLALRPPLTGAPAKLPSAARIVLREPVPLPRDLGEGVTLGQGPTLVTFWAQWCVICQAELKEFAQHDTALRQAGLSLLPLSVDEPDDHDKARRAARNLKLPEPVRFVSADQTTLFASLLKETLDIHQDMTIPLSFLVDGQGRIQVIYSGPAPVEALLRDTRALAGGSGAEPLSPSHPPGRWYANPQRSYANIISDLRDAKLLDWARFYLQQDRQARGL